MMQNTTIRRFLHFYFGLLGLIGMILLCMLSLRYTVGISPDSVAYISVARHLIDGTGFICYDGYFYVLQAPLYPMLLAAVTLATSIDPVISAGCINALLFGLIVYSSGILFVRHLRSPALAQLGTTSVLFSFVLVQAALIALSELLFILFTILTLLAFDVYGRRKSRTTLLMLAVMVALACLTRYVGVVLILTGVVFLLGSAGNNGQLKFKHCLLFLMVTLLPTGLWVARNYYFTGTLVGQRSASLFTLSDNFFFMFGTLYSWISPGQKSRQEIILFAGFVTLCILIAIAGLIRSKRPHGQLRTIIPVFLFTILYSVLILVSSTTTAYDKIDSRLLSPLFVPVILCMLIIIENIIEWMMKYTREGVLSVIIIIELTLWMKYQLATTKASVTKYMAQAGCEYSGKEWKDNSVIAFLNKNREIAPAYAFYSNVPEAVYLLAGINAKWSPPKTQYNSPVLLNESPNLDALWSEKKVACIVWFNNMDRNFLFGIEELKQSTNMQRIALLKDGEIYTVTGR